MSSDSAATRAALRGTPRLVDLSLTVSTGMPTHAAFPPPVIVRYSDHDASLALKLGTPDDPHTSAVNYITMLDHVGTHVDAPLHVSPTGAAIDELPLSTFTGSAVCLDLQHVPDLGDIDVQDMERAEIDAGVAVAGHIVLICTGFHRRNWVDPPDIFSDDAEWAARSREVLTTNPGLTAAATEWLADRGSRVHGVEGPSTDKAGTNDYPSHRVCRDRGLIHYEWLVNLEELLGVGESDSRGTRSSGKGAPDRPFVQWRKSGTRRQRLAWEARELMPDRLVDGSRAPLRATVLVATAFFVDAAMWSVVVPLLPRYQSTFGLSTTQVGFVFAAYSAAMALGAVPAGRLADRFGARRWTAVGCLVMGGATVGLGLSHSYAALIAARLAQGVASATIWGAGPAWIAGISTGHARFRAIAIAQGTAALGLIAGPFIGGIGTTDVGPRATFTIVGALSGVLCIAVLCDRRPYGAPYAVPRPPTPIRRSLHDSVIVCSIVIVASCSLVAGGLQVLAPLHLASVGVTQSEIGGVYSIGAVLGAAMLFLLARTQQSGRRLEIAIAASVLTSVMTAGLALPLDRNTFVGFVLVLVPLQSTLYALAYPMSTDGADRAGVGTGTVMGIMNLSWAAAAIAGPVGASALQELAGPTSAYVVLGTVAFAAAIATRYLNRTVGLFTP